MEDRVEQRGDDQHGAASTTAASSGRREGRQGLLLKPKLPQNHPEAAGQLFPKTVLDQSYFMPRIALIEYR